MSNLTNFDVKEEDVQNVERLQVSLEDSLRWIMDVNFPSVWVTIYLIFYQILKDICMIRSSVRSVVMTFYRSSAGNTILVKAQEAQILWLKLTDQWDEGRIRDVTFLDSSESEFPFENPHSNEDKRKLDIRENFDDFSLWIDDFFRKKLYLSIRKSFVLIRIEIAFNTILEKLFNFQKISI